MLWNERRCTPLDPMVQVRGCRTHPPVTFEELTGRAAMLLQTTRPYSAQAWLNGVRRLRPRVWTLGLRFLP